VVFVGGYARTGSTLLDRLLGQIEGFASFGELRHVWDRNFRGNQLCGCRLPFRECPFWTEVVRDAFGGFDAVDAAAVSRDGRTVNSLFDVPRLLSGGWTSGWRERYARYTAAVAALYRAMQRVSGARWLVDSTKDPQHAYVLRELPGFEIRLVHLVRDGRAVAHSWQRVRNRPEITWRQQDMPRFPVVRSALAWDVTNLAAEGLTRLGVPTVRVRYEDLVRDAGRELERIVDGLGLGTARLDFLGPGTARLGPAHTVAGNPMRFEEGIVELRPDEEWTDRMPPMQRAVVTALTAPLLARYGYRFRGVPPGRASSPSPQA
jgi:hypothetical protein